LAAGAAVSAAAGNSYAQRMVEIGATTKVAAEA
jgi:hypothetical protein